MKEEKRWFLEGSQHPIPKDVCEKHKSPSPQTVEEINNIKVNFARMEEKLQNGFENVGEKIDSLIIMLTDLKKEKADKWTEKAIFAIMGGFATLLIGLVIYLLTH